MVCGITLVDNRQAGEFCGEGSEHQRSDMVCSGDRTGFLQPHSTHSTLHSLGDIPSQTFPLGLGLSFGPGLVMADTETIYSTWGQMSGRASFHDARPPRRVVSSLLGLLPPPLGLSSLLLPLAFCFLVVIPWVASELLLGENRAGGQLEMTMLTGITPCPPPPLPLGYILG